VVNVVNKIDNYIVVANEQVDNVLLDKTVTFDKTIFPLDKDYSVPDEIFKELYRENKDGLFVLLDKFTQSVIGYLHCIFLTDEQRDKYLIDKDYLCLKNIGFQLGNNNMYFYTMAVAEQYRGTNVVKILAKAFAKWLYDGTKQGKNITFCFSDAITQQGVKTLYRMGMIPYNANKSVEKDGMVTFISPDCLDAYINKILNTKIKGER